MTNQKCQEESSRCSYEISWDKLESSQKNPKQTTPASQWWRIRGTLGTALPPSWTILEVSCGPRSWKQPFHGHRESPVWNWDSWGCQNHWAHSKAAVGVRVPGGGISKSTVLLYENHGDPGKPDFESETSSHVLLILCTGNWRTWKPIKTQFVFCLHSDSLKMLFSLINVKIGKFCFGEAA